jgi:Ras-related protein Rab-5C
MLSLKVTMIGKSTVGKTSIVTRTKYGHCDEKVFATVGVSFVEIIRDNIQYKIWDTAGQERYYSLNPMYFRDSRIIIFVFDVSDISTLDHLTKYLHDLNNIDNYWIIVVGNKIDLLNDDELNEVTHLTVDKLKESPIKDYIFTYVFVSAKTGENFETFLTKLDNCAKTIRGNISNIPIIYETVMLKNNDPLIIEEASCRC